MRTRSLALLVTSMAAALVPPLTRAEDASVAPGKQATPFACPKDMVAIPGGTFEHEGKPVTVKPFCIERTEVTLRDFERCLESYECDDEGLADISAAIYKSERKDAPINGVNWAQASTYCRSRGRRLPSVLEWIWAARGGPEARKYPWGDEPPGKQLCWNGPGKDESRFSVCDVLEHPGDRTAQGVLGMAGNVAEWTSTSAPERQRLLCGGEFATTKADDVATSSACSPDDPKKHQGLIGIRCAATPRR